MKNKTEFASYMWVILSDLAALSTLLIGGVAFVGHLIKIESAYHWLSYPPMAFNTAIAIALLSLAILMKNRNQAIVMRTIESISKKIDSKETR